jgi:hypothetical protein
LKLTRRPCSVGVLRHRQQLGCPHTRAGRSGSSAGARSGGSARQELQQTPTQTGGTSLVRNAHDGSREPRKAGSPATVASAASSSARVLPRGASASARRRKRERPTEQARCLQGLHRWPASAAAEDQRHRRVLPPLRGRAPGVLVVWPQENHDLRIGDRFRHGSTVGPGATEERDQP